MEKRLIDADEASRRIIAFATGLHSVVLSVDTVMMLLTQEPTVDAVEVVHGHWISKGYKIECSVCEHRVFLGTRDPVIHTEEKNVRKYCHNCGAKMDGGDDG